MLRLSAVFAASIAPIAPALAHTGAGGAAGFSYGFAHPVGGLDHVLAMLTVGVMAATLAGRAMWLVPAAFVGAMTLGGALGLASFSLPLVELGIGLSVVALGAAVALRVKMPAVAAMGFVGLFAIFHGHAHGSEIPEGLSALTYGAGFIAATVLLHLLGIGLGSALGRFARVTQAAGALIASAGMGMIAGVV